uniref:Uncharacterized protein n=1 Tax=Oryza punctata TaxID=4537 RepID=A0A0E0JT86_ORYPU
MAVDPAAAATTTTTGLLQSPSPLPPGDRGKTLFSSEYETYPDAAAQVSFQGTQLAIGGSPTSPAEARAPTPHISQSRTSSRRGLTSLRRVFEAL